MFYSQTLIVHVFFLLLILIFSISDTTTNAPCSQGSRCTGHAFSAPLHWPARPRRQEPSHCCAVQLRYCMQWHAYWVSHWAWMQDRVWIQCERYKNHINIAFLSYSLLNTQVWLLNWTNHALTSNWLMLVETFHLVNGKLFEKWSSYVSWIFNFRLHVQKGSYEDHSCKSLQDLPKLYASRTHISKLPCWAFGKWPNTIVCCHNIKLT